MNFDLLYTFGHDVNKYRLQENEYMRLEIDEGVKLLQWILNVKIMYQRKFDFSDFWDEKSINRGS